MRLLYEQLTDIPVGFTEVEYIQSTGTQWIDTGVYVNNTLKTDIHFEVVDKTQGGHIFGGRTVTSGGRGYGVYLPTSGGIGFDYETRLTSNVSTTNGYKYRVVKDGASNTLYVNDVQSYTGNNTAATFDLNVKMALFYMKDSNTSFNASVKCKVFYFKIWDNNVLVRDFIPCLDTNNTPCLWDKVEGKAYYNQGTGTFNVGRKIIPVEYIESSGTQYIDTGYTSNDIYTNSACEVICETSDLSNRIVGCGGLNDNNKNISLSFSGGGYILGLYGDRWTSNIFSYSTNTKYKIKFEVSTSQQKLYVNDNLVDTTTYSWNSSNNYPLRLFKTNADTYTKPTKIYSFKLWISDTLIRDYISCKDENNVGYMFDKVTHSCFLNAGSGSFLVGNELPKQKLRFLKDNKLRVPNGFTEVEYLQSTGTQYIMSGLSMPNGFRVKGTLVIDDLSATGGVFGCYTNSSPYYRNFFDFTSANNWLVGFGGGAYQYFGSNVTNTKYTFNICNVHNNEQLEINGTSYAVSPSGSTGNFSNFEMPVFALNVSGTISNISKIKLYCLQIYNENDILMRDFIPCLDTNNTPCLWDRVESKAYYNAGTGTFNYGNKIIPVEYLESTGTQYIDTGYIPTNTTGQYAKMQYTTVNNSVTFGCMVSGNGAVGPYYVTSSSTVGWWIRWGSNEPRVTAPTPTTTDTYEMYLNFNNDRIARVDSTVIEGNLGNISGNYPTLTLFKRNYTVGGNLTGKVFNYKITEGTNLVRDFIPCKDENGVGYMFDTISHSLYSNAGTGSFVVGNEIKNITRFLEGA